MTVLMAAVTGSHSFGFLYVHKDKQTYLSLSQPVQVIQLKAGLYDDWDLFKSSSLTVIIRCELVDLDLMDQNDNEDDPYI